MTTTLCTAMRYHDSRDSGVGTAWMLFIGLGWSAVLMGCTTAAIILFIQRAFRARTLQK
ncbi:MAG: hypothetical protein H0V56_14045 [Chthoniobacterales bacterium]|nr:hypothetical protein [Chthoniobacterales bacterium]